MNGSVLPPTHERCLPRFAPPTLRGSEKRSLPELPRPWLLQQAFRTRVTPAAHSASLLASSLSNSSRRRCTNFLVSRSDSLQPSGRDLQLHGPLRALQALGADLPLLLCTTDN